MTTLPRISIITPSYNQGGFIRQTIESVLNQEYPNLEYIVIDGGSTDSTTSILKEYGNQVDWVSEKDRGQSHAINKGLQKASGEIVGFINSDDLFEPGALNKVGKFFSENKKAKWLTGKCRIIDSNGIEIRKAITLYKNMWLHLKSKKLLFVINYISQPSTFWRREVLDKVGYFDEKREYSMDYDYWLRMQKHYTLSFINAYLANFRVHLSSKAGSSANALVNEALDVLKLYETSPFLIFLHKLHDDIIVLMYSKLLGVEKT